jgi:hypothetical protein
VRTFYHNFTRVVRIENKVKTRTLKGEGCGTPLAFSEQADFFVSILDEVPQEDAAQ